MVDHGERKHAILSASGASRWMNCTPSARMEEEFSKGKERKSSSYADEGTLAHEFADLHLRIRSHVGSRGVKAKWESELAELRKHKLYTDEMEDFVRLYTGYVLAQWVAADRAHGDATLLIEERVNFSHLVPEGFGTSDAIVCSDGTLEVIDLKYGKGVKVYAKGNPQGRLYALGALRRVALLYDIKTVTVTIVQPRLDHIDSETISVEELEQWGREQVAPAASAAWDGTGEAKPGDWCKWCSAKPVCRALAEKSRALATVDFTDGKTLSDQEVIEHYGHVNNVLDWAKSLSEYVKNEAIKGKKWPGYKLVEGRSTRKWKDEAEALGVLQENGFELSELTNSRLKAIGDAEKLVGKAKLQSLDLLVKPPGAPTLVPESDKRPEFGAASIQEDFKEDIKLNF